MFSGIRTFGRHNFGQFQPFCYSADITSAVEQFSTSQCVKFSAIENFLQVKIIFEQSGYPVHIIHNRALPEKFCLYGHTLLCTKFLIMNFLQKNWLILTLRFKLHEEVFKTDFTLCKSLFLKTSVKFEYCEYCNTVSYVRIDFILLCSLSIILV